MGTKAEYERQRETIAYLKPNRKYVYCKGCRARVVLPCILCETRTRKFTAAAKGSFVDGVRK